MAYYGINSGSLSAGADNDTISMGGNRSTSITGASVYGGEGNDLLSFAAVGSLVSSPRVIAAANGTEEVTGTLSGVLTTQGGAVYSSSYDSFTGAGNYQVAP